MPIHDVGYRSWSGRLMSTLTRWWVITEAGIKINLKNSWVKRTLFLAWLPVFGAGGGIFLAEKMLEQSTKNPEFAGQIYQVFDAFSQGLPNFEPVREALAAGDHNAVRSAMWSWIILNFLRLFQGVSCVLLLGLITPPLVAQDVRSRAFQLYYARPIGRVDYLVGKLAIPAFFIMLITTGPALGLYCFGLMMSPDLSVIYDTWQIPVQILICSAVLILPTCTLALMLSSLTHESRFAGFAWFAVWGLGFVAWNIVRLVRIEQLESSGFTGPIKIESNWTLVSLYDTLGKVQTWVFGLDDRALYALPSMILLIGITVLSLAVLFRRVAAPLRA